MFLQQDNSHFVKLVVALYPFKAIEGGDLSLEKVRHTQTYYLCKRKTNTTKWINRMPNTKW